MMRADRRADWDRVGAAWFAAMRQGDFPAAWQASDQVLTMRHPAGQDDPAQPYHLRWLWDGTPLDGRDILVRCYHGLGDTLQFCRYLPALRARAARVTLEVQAELLPLVATMGAVDRALPFDPAAPCPLPPGGVAVEIMELAHALRLPPRPVPYLRIERTRAGPQPRVGVCWQVRPGWRPERSMPQAAAASLALDGLALHSLQKGLALPGMAPCPDAVTDTARVIAGLDLVVTVDTMVAHLAGAIGVPVWLLLDTAPDWRWLAPSATGGATADGTGDGSPWYRAVRKYRQHQPGDWHAPLQAVIADLTRLVRAGTVDVQTGSWDAWIEASASSSSG